MTHHLQQDTSEGKVLVTNYSGLLLCCCSVAKSCPTLRHPTDCSTPGLPVPHSLPSLSRFTSIGSVMPSNHLILCHPLLLSSIFPSIRVFSNELALYHIRWPKYWSFSFSISTSNEYSGLIFFRVDWFDFLAVPATPKSHLQHHNLKVSILQQYGVNATFLCSHALFYGNICFTVVVWN